MRTRGYRKKLKFLITITRLKSMVQIMSLIINIDAII